MTTVQYLLSNSAAMLFIVCYKQSSNQYYELIFRMHLYQADSRANIHQQIRKNCFSIGSLKLVLWTTMALVNKCLIRNVFEKKIATFNQALHLIFLVNAVSIQNKQNLLTMTSKKNISFKPENKWKVYCMQLYI